MTLPSSVSCAPAKENSPSREVDIKAESDSFFYIGEERRQEVMVRMMQIIREAKAPGSILVSSDDNLDWLFSDYMLMKQLQAGMMEACERGFSFHQIIPALNHLSRYTEALQFWLPLYTTGQVKVHYYPRLRDNLYRRSLIAVPDRYVHVCTTIGSGSNNDISMFSTNPGVIDAHVQQFKEHLSLCRPALSTYSDPKDFIPCFLDIFSREGDNIQMVAPLSINTMPRELLQRCIQETEHPEWKITYQMYLNEIPNFERRLTQGLYIDMSRLATADEVRQGKVYVATTYPSFPGHLRYTPETYILHLKNILRLMEEYENYHFVPYNKQETYNLVVNNDGLALLMRVSAPPLLLKMNRPEMVMACQEHLLRKAEQIGYGGMYRTKNQLMILNLIEELEG